ncbi:hypothetical protein H6504_04210 [Candidatus Woesearchaeota archaeon]|nr:hypothetical protein [Candidatus Woesearchaeota archaeon]
MIIKILGLLDLISATILLFGELLPNRALFYAGMYLCIKGFFFGRMGDIASWIDLLVGVYVFAFAIFNLEFGMLTIVALIYLYQKALFSFV